MSYSFQKILILIFGLIVIITLAFAFIQFIFIPSWVKQIPTPSTKSETQVESVTVNQTSSSSEKTLEKEQLKSTEKTTLEEKSSSSSNISKESVNTKNSSTSSSNKWQRGKSENQIAAYNI